MKKTKINLVTVVTCAVFAAIYAVLASFSIGTNSFKVAVGSMAILITALSMGPTAGFFTGLVGEFIYQVVQYGIDPTTVLWLIPLSMEGLVAGLICKKSLGNVPKKTVITAIVVGEVLHTALITPVNGISAIIQGWGNWPMIIAGIPLRVAILAVRLVVYIIIIPLIYDRIKKVVK